MEDLAERLAGFWGNFQKLPPDFSEVFFTIRERPDATNFGASSQKFASEVVAEAHLVVHTAPPSYGLCT